MPARFVCGCCASYFILTWLVTLLHQIVPRIKFTPEAAPNKAVPSDHCPLVMTFQFTTTEEGASSVRCNCGMIFWLYFSFIFISIFVHLGVKDAQRTCFTSLLQTAQGPRRLRSADAAFSSSGTTPRAASASGTTPRAASASGATPRASVSFSAEFFDVAGA